MGVGYAEDLVVCVALGVDLFDCVYPTRTARFGNAITSHGIIPLRNSRYRFDFEPLDRECECVVCRPRDKDNGMGITRAYLHHLACKETAGAHLVTLHNVHYQLNLMRKARQAILAGKFSEFVRSFFYNLYDGRTEAYPQWAVDILRTVGIDLHDGINGRDISVE